MSDLARDPFADDVLNRLAQSDYGYQREHGHYIVPLAERLLAARDEISRLREQLDAARKALQHYADQDTWDLDQLSYDESNTAGYVFWHYDGHRAEEPWAVARAALGVEGEPPMECGARKVLHVAGEEDARVYYCSLPAGHASMHVERDLMWPGVEGEQEPGSP